MPGDGAVDDAAARARMAWDVEPATGEIDAQWRLGGGLDPADNLRGGDGRELRRRFRQHHVARADLGAEPLPILNVGLTCQGRNGYGAQRDKYKKGELTEEQWQSYLSAVALTPGTAEWQSYVQDILDLIEYANGDITTKWGEIRAENGHPEPYNLKYIGLGNENWGDVYFRNFDALLIKVKSLVKIEGNNNE